MVFETRDINVGWDGYYRGELCQQDVYAYYIAVTYNDGNDTYIEKTGDITLIR